MRKLSIFVAVGISVLLGGCLQTMPEMPSSQTSLRDIQTRRFMYDETMTRKGIHSYFSKERKCIAYVELYRCREVMFGFLDNRAAKDIIYSLEVTSGGNYTDVRIRRENGNPFETYQEVFDAITNHIKHEASK